MNTHTNEINSDSSERKYVHLSNGLIQNFEIRYTFRIWIRPGRCGFILWECCTCPLFGGGLQLRFAIFLYVNECGIILKFGATVSCALTRETRHKPIAWRTHLLDCMKCSTLDGDPFTRWSHSREIKALYGRIIVYLSQEQLGYLTKYIIHWNRDLKTFKLIAWACQYTTTLKTDVEPLVCVNTSI